jgi:hypothetical protein
MEDKKLEQKSNPNEAEKPHPMSYFKDDLMKQADVMLFALDFVRPQLYIDLLPEDEKLQLGVRVHKQFGFLGDSKELGFYSFLVGSLSINLKCNKDKTTQNYNLGFAYPLYKRKREEFKGLGDYFDTVDTVENKWIVNTYAQAMMWLSGHNINSDGKTYQVTSSYEDLVSQINKVQIFSTMFVIDNGDKVRPDNKYWDYDFIEEMYGDNNEYRQVVHDALIERTPTHIRDVFDYYGRYFELEDINISEELQKINTASLKQHVPRSIAEFMSLRPVKKEEEQSDILYKLSDRDASVLCELVYENDFFDDVADIKVGKSIADLLYTSDKMIDTDVINLLSDTAKLDYKKYADYYHPILDKYKLVATSKEYDVNNAFSGCDYYAIAVANMSDDNSKGIYIINRGTKLLHDFIDDLAMGAGKLIPSPRIVPHMLQGIDFGNKILDTYRPLSIGFSGHSLGGAISQIQTVNFVNNEQGASVAPTKCFEPFGTRSEVDPSIAVTIGDRYFTTTTDIWTSVKNWSNILSGGYLFADWKSLEVKLMDNYRSHSGAINGNIKNFARHGDFIAELSEQIGSVVPLNTSISSSYYDSVLKQAKGLVAVPESLFTATERLNLHSITWYRYNRYADDGTLITSGVNEVNVAKISKPEKIAEYNEVFSGV